MIGNRAILEAAILGFEQQKRRIDETIAELRAQLSGGSSAPTPKTPAAPPAERKPKRKMSAKAKKAIRDAQKKRWAAFHAGQKAEKPKAAVKAAATSTAKAAPAPKRKMSAATKAKLVANLKKARAAKAAKKSSGEGVPF